MTMGRPLKFQDVDELKVQIDRYFNETPKDEWTWTGLALYLDTDKETLKDYRENRADFIAPLKNAMLKVENGYELDLKKSGRTGTIFALKNFEWKDKTETEVTGKDGKDLYPHPILDVVPKDHSNPEDNKPQ